MNDQESQLRQTLVLDRDDVKIKSANKVLFESNSSPQNLRPVQTEEIDEEKLVKNTKLRYYLEGNTKEEIIILLD